jgi:hypothetical protein
MTMVKITKVSRSSISGFLFSDSLHTVSMAIQFTTSLRTLRLRRAALTITSPMFDAEAAATQSRKDCLSTTFGESLGKHKPASNLSTTQVWWVVPKGIPQVRRPE